MAYRRQEGCKCGMEGSVMLKQCGRLLLANYGCGVKSQVFGGWSNEHPHYPLPSCQRWHEGHCGAQNRSGRADLQFSAITHCKRWSASAAVSEKAQILKGLTTLSPTHTLPH